MRTNVPGVHIPDAVVARIEGAKDQKAEGKRLCIDLLAATGIDFHIFFPTAPAAAETGHRRGAVVVTASAEDARILADIPHLRLWRPAVIPHAHAHPSGAQWSARI